MEGEMSWRTQFLKCGLAALAIAVLAQDRANAQVQQYRAPIVKHSAEPNPAPPAPNSTPAAPSIPPEMTQVVACPATTRAIQQPSPPLPWEAYGAQLVVADARIGHELPHQNLLCFYGQPLQDSAGHPLPPTNVGTMMIGIDNLPPGSCVLAPDHKSFRCKPGAVPP